MPRKRKTVSTNSVCIIGSGWQFTSGISYYTCLLARSLQPQFDVSVILMRRLIPKFLYPGKERVGKPVNTLQYPPNMPVFDGIDWFWFPSIIRGCWFLARRKPSVVIFQWWTGAVLHSYLVLAVVARLTGAKVVVEFHETQDTGEARMKGAGRYLGVLGNALLSHADAFVVHSQFDETAVRSMFDVHDKLMEIIPLGPFDHHLAAGDLETAPTRSSAVTPAPAGVLTLLFFGTIRPYKGLEHLVEAFDLLSEEQVRRFRLLIVGETWENWTRPLELAKASKYSDRISVVNRYVHDDEVTDFFSAADVVVLPYTRSSASGPLHTAMAHGLPTILTDVGGLRENAGDYEGITWIPPNSVEALRDALLAIPSTPPQRYEDARSWEQTRMSYTNLLAGLKSR